MMRRAASLVLTAFALLLFAVRPAHAQDAFEIQVYDAETAAPGAVGFELHVNNFAVGGQTSEAPELPTNHATHLTLEPHIGIAKWCEAGAYIQTAIRGDGTFDFAGLKLRFKMRVPKRIRSVLGLALNLEVSTVPETYEANRYGMELRPILDVRWNRLYFSINPIVTMELGGPLAGHPRLEPSAKFAVRVAPFMAIGPEYYAAFGAVDQFLPRDKQTHRLFAAIDFSHEWGRVALGVNVGAGYGFTGDDKWIVKAIVGIDYERLFAGPASPCVPAATAGSSPAAK